MQGPLASYTFISLHLYQPQFWKDRVDCPQNQTAKSKFHCNYILHLTLVHVQQEFAGNINSPVELENFSKCWSPCWSNKYEVRFDSIRTHMVILRSRSRRKKEKSFISPSGEKHVYHHMIVSSKLSESSLYRFFGHVKGHYICTSLKREGAWEKQVHGECSVSSVNVCH